MPTHCGLMSMIRATAPSTPAANHDTLPSCPMTEKTCRDCDHFNDDPAFIEAQFPGMTALGSAYGSTRGPAGICRELGRFMDPMPAEQCESFTPLDESGD